MKIRKASKEFKNGLTTPEYSYRPKKEIAMKNGLKTTSVARPISISSSQYFHLGKQKCRRDGTATPVVTVSYYEPPVEPQPSVTPLVVEPEPEAEAEWEMHIATAYCP